MGVKWHTPIKIVEDGDYLLKMFRLVLPKTVVVKMALSGGGQTDHVLELDIPTKTCEIKIGDTLEFVTGGAYCGLPLGTRCVVTKVPQQYGTENLHGWR